MAHRFRIRPEGFWTVTSVVDPTEFEALDAGQFSAVDGDAGGAWAPAKQIIIGAAGVKFDNCPVEGTWVPNTPITIIGAGLACNSGVLFNIDSAVLAKGTFSFDPACFLTFNTKHASIAGGALLTVASGGAIALGAGSSLNANGGSTIAVLQGGSLDIRAGGTLDAIGPATFSDLTMVGTTNVQLAPRSITRVSELPAFQVGTDWLVGASTQYIENTSSSNQGQHTLLFPLHIPHGAKLTAVSISVDGGGPHAAVPATKPSLRVVRMKLTDGSVAQLGNITTDPSSSPAALDAPHTITVSGLSETVDRTAYRYHAYFVSDFGANATRNATVFGPSVTYTPTAYDED
jgi:hypothetical protein